MSLPDAIIDPLKSTPNGVVHKLSEELPTLDLLGESLPDNVDATQVAKEWLEQFAKAVETADADAFATAFLSEGWWRDKVVFTWDQRSIQGHDAIKRAFIATGPRTAATGFELGDIPPVLASPYPGLSFVQAHFRFTTKVAIASGIVNLVPYKGTWKAWTVLTLLEDLKDFPEKPRPRGTNPKYTTWAEQREAETEFKDSDPTVIIIGGGHSGLTVAARLNAMGVSNVVIEKNARAGDNWRTRYEALSLHDPVWTEHFPYMPFPKHWPIFTPASKLANWIEFYAEALDINIWLSSKITQATYNKEKKRWEVTVERPGKPTRTLSSPQIVIATGLGGGTPRIPDPLPGQETFPTSILHSTQYKSGKAWKNQNVLVVGTSSSGFDIAYDLFKHGAKVTMLQRSPTYIMSIKNGSPAFMGLYREDGPPYDLVDRIGLAIPIVASKALVKGIVDEVAKKDKDLLEGMNAAGFRTWLGMEGCGFIFQALRRAGGYYFDSGACAEVIAGNIKIQPGTIDHFDGNVITFSDGKSAAYDHVVFATGFKTMRDSIRTIFGDEIADKSRDVWDIDEGGEVKGVWRPMGLPGFHVMIASFAWARIQSKLMVLNIVAQQNGLCEEPYEE
ncbi:monooxygenase protein [Calocera viscosa TUFC12733]|uniref:Monooxygenase protein n=1 Tax=Calocera viscosa (strain TUFC12733) TaxID=1330018 RepID=A0A167FJP9_CALVF|nr:monooxygenase protein [Calocera viscosa TUFC12733]